MAPGFAGISRISFIHRSDDLFTKTLGRTFALECPRSIIGAPMTKREAIRVLENLALETGHKKNYYVKRALIEFLDRKEHLLGPRRTNTNGFSILDDISSRLNRFQ